MVTIIAHQTVGGGAIHAELAPTSIPLGSTSAVNALPVASNRRDLQQLRAVAHVQLEATPASERQAARAVQRCPADTPPVRGQPAVPHVPRAEYQTAPLRVVKIVQQELKPTRPQGRLSA